MIPRRVFSMSLVAGILAYGAPMLAQKTAATPPKNATAQCQDGTYSTAKTERGACAKHGGVKTWFGSPAEKTTAAPKASDTSNASSSGKSSAKSSEKPSSTTAAAKTQGRASTTGSAPKDATAQCKDGTYSRAKTRERACSQHGGVAEWFADNAPKGTAPESRTTGTSGSPSPATAKPVPSTPREETAPTVARDAGVPANATAKCKDGTYSFAKGHTGACSHHGGVAQWYK